MIARLAIAFAAASLAACVHVEHTSHPATSYAAHHPAPRIVMEEFRVPASDDPSIQLYVRNKHPEG
jgi:hypothetical protein